MKRSTAIIEENTCFENFYAGIGRDDASPLVINNVCYGNVRAGIGISEGACPTVRGNKCYENRRAGIGIRTGAGTQPIVERNECYENEMAGIGNRDDARPVIRHNRCYKNQMAGIGVHDPMSMAVIVGNRCLENRLVAIGLPDGATGYIHGNELLRTAGGAPPLLAVKGGSVGVVSGNRIAGGGVAGVLVQGEVRILDNRFQGKGAGQGSAVWVWKDSKVVVANNRFHGYRNAINASGAQVTATDNVTHDFEGAAMIVKKPSDPAHVHGNIAVSERSADVAANVEGDPEAATGNELRRPSEFDSSRHPSPPAWLPISGEHDGEAVDDSALQERQVSVTDGPWKLVATYGKQTRLALFNTKDDPQETIDLSRRLEQITYRLRGVLEKRDAGDP